MDSHFTIDGKAYAIDLDKFMEFCSAEQNVVDTITQTYAVDDNGVTSLVSKEIAETKDNINEVMSNYRYTTLSSLLNILTVPVADGSGTIITTEDMNSMHIGQKLAFNTMLEMGIIYEIDNSEE